MEPQPVTDKQRAFAIAYASTYSVSKAAAACGISPNTGSDYLKDPRVQAIVRERSRLATERAGVSVDMVLETLQAILTTDIHDFLRFDADGHFAGLKLDPTELTAAQRAAIKAIKPTKYGTVLELHDRMAAVEKAGKYLGMWSDKIEISGPGGGPVPIDIGMTPQEAAEMYAHTIKPGQ